MKKLLFCSIWIFILCLCSIESFSFGCKVDGTCFGQCIQKGYDLDYCKIKCEKCGW